jgi:hypothetical protein
VPLGRAFLTWKRYRGGQTTPIWTADLGDWGIERLPHQVSDGMSDAQYAAFDKNGKYLYFTASTNLGERGLARHVQPRSRSRAACM